MICKDYVLIDKKEATIFESMCILIENSDKLFKNKKWFLLFLENKFQKQLYIKFTKLNFNLNQFRKSEIIDQYDKDVPRTQFQLNKNYEEFLIDNRINHEITYNVVKKLIKKHYKLNSQKFYRVLFLCSQTSLAFIVNQIHFSILSDDINEKQPLIIGELSNTLKQKQKRKMKIKVMLENNEVIVEKHLRILKNDTENHEMIPIYNFKLIIYFKIDDKNEINAIVNIQKL